MNKGRLFIVFALSINVLQGMGRVYVDEYIKDDITEAQYPLHAAVKDCDCGKLLALLNHQSIQLVIDAPNPTLNGSTALHEACAYGTPEMVNLLLVRGADTEVKTMTDELTPLNMLMKALSHDSKHDPKRERDVASLLLDSGADVNTVDVNGNTPLHGACSAVSSTMVVLLLRHGATEIPNNAQKLPRDSVLENPNILELLDLSVKKSTTMKIPKKKKIFLASEDWNELP